MIYSTNITTQYVIFMSDKFNVQYHHHELPQNCSRPICLQGASESLTDSFLHVSPTSFYRKMLRYVRLCSISFVLANYLHVYTGLPLSLSSLQIHTLSLHLLPIFSMQNITSCQRMWAKGRTTVLSPLAVVNRFVQP